MKKEYRELCDRCDRDLEPSRSVVHGVTFWLHDGIYNCKASELREKDYLAKEKEKG